jgi:hypothetical protein
MLSLPVTAAAGTTLLTKDKGATVRVFPPLSVDTKEAFCEAKGIIVIPADPVAPVPPVAPVTP